MTLMKNTKMKRKRETKKGQSENEKGKTKKGQSENLGILHLT